MNEWNPLSCETSQVAVVVKNLPVNAGDVRDASSTPGLGRCPGDGNGNPLQYSYLENPRDSLQSMGLQRVIYNWSELAHITHSYWEKNQSDLPTISYL